MARVFFTVYRTIMTIKDYTVLYRTIQEDLIQVYTGPNRTIQDYTRPFITIHDRTGLCKIKPDYIGLFRTIPD